MTTEQIIFSALFLGAAFVISSLSIYQWGKEKGCQSHFWVPGKIYCTHCGKEADYTGQELKIDTEY